jgi:hypothetical protein
MMMRQFAGADMRTRNPRILGTESAAEFIQGQWGTVWGREAGDRRGGRGQTGREAAPDASPS